MGMKAVKRLEKKEIEENAAVKDEMLGKKDATDGDGKQLSV